MTSKLADPAIAQPASAPSTKKKSPWQTWRTMDDTSKLQTNQLLLETSSRLNDAFTELCTFLDSLDSDLTALSNQRKHGQDDVISRIRSKLRLIHHPVLPMVYIAVETIQDAALTLAPVGSTLQLHERNEARRKSEAVCSYSGGGSKKKDGCRMQLMGDFLERSSLDWVQAVGERCVGSRLALGVQQEEGEGDCEEMIMGAADLKVPALPPIQLGGNELGVIEAGYAAGLGTNLSACESNRTHKKRSRGKRFQDESNDERTNTIRSKASKDAGDDDPGSEQDFGTETTVDVDALVSGLKKVDASESNLEKGKSAASCQKTNDTSPSMPSSQPLKKRKLAAVSRQSKSTALPKKKTKKQRATKARAKEFPLPPPAKGSQYTKPEAVSIARAYPKDTNARGSAMQAMIDKGYVPSSKRTIQRLIKLTEDEGKPVPDTPWGSSNGGAPPILGNSDIDAIVARIIHKNARIHGKSDIVEMLVHAARAKMKQRGEDPEGAKTRFSSGVIHNYWVIFKSKLPERYWA
ncbi:hypothetical protein ACHAWO_001296 [Cyclotella atomus]|uniref:Uncharacterized protein n=1 Tax=Cyclotella atomus TaxID=382360 RepID=A0ABD3NHJ5_9STRA